ncbi:MAG TPA: S1C family serine protease [Lachnospiraceae bacterium]
MSKDKIEKEAQAKVAGSQQYDFIKETVKDRQDKKKNLINQLVWMGAKGLIFGICMAISFLAVKQVFLKSGESKGQESQVLIPKEEETGEAQLIEDAKPLVEAEKESGLATYARIQADMDKVVEESKKSMVTVTGIKNNTDWFNQMYEQAEKTPGIIVADTGSDFFILTDYKIIAGKDKIRVSFTEDEAYEAKYQKHDPESGITILKLDKSSLSEAARKNHVAANLGSSYGLSQGQSIFVMGSPGNYANALVYGKITSIKNRITVMDNQYSLVNTDIIGSSGGCGYLFNLEGQVVGVIVQKYAPDPNKENIVALGISPLKSLIERLSNKGELPYIGIYGQDISEKTAKENNLPRGIWIESVAEKSPAMSAGLAASDIIVKIKDTEVESLAQYHSALMGLKVGDVVPLLIKRQGPEGYIEISIDVTIQSL